MLTKDFQNVKVGYPPTIKMKAELGFLNEKAPHFFNRKPVYVCFITERSDGHLIDFRRFSAKKLENGETLLLSAQLLNEAQYITCYVSCDELGES